MFSVIFSFLGTPLGKIVGYIGAGIALALVIWAGIAIRMLEKKRSLSITKLR